MYMDLQLGFRSSEEWEVAKHAIQQFSQLTQSKELMIELAGYYEPSFRAELRGVLDE